MKRSSLQRQKLEKILVKKFYEINSLFSYFDVRRGHEVHHLDKFIWTSNFFSKFPQIAKHDENISEKNFFCAKFKVNERGEKRFQKFLDDGTREIVVFASDSNKNKPLHK